MKIRVLPLLIALAAGLSVQPAHAAAVSISAGIQINAVGDFYQPLEPYGTWVNVGSYGRCFHPTHVAADWRPYTLGHWEYTDVGWFWVSDEPFGWACFHYGSWIQDPNLGWIWVPGIEWSPAWVTWRESDSYIGWAPCGPNLAVAAPSLFVFVGLGNFLDPIRPSTVIVNNTTVINNTRVVNNFRSETRSFDGGQRRMRVNAGPEAARIQHATGRNVSPTPIKTAVERTNARRSNEQPQQQRSTATPAQPSREPSPVTPEQQRQERPATIPEQSKEQSVTTPQQPSVQEPSGSAREHKPSETPAPSAPGESTVPSAPQEAQPPTPAPEKPAVQEPSGATRQSEPVLTPHETPAPSAPQAVPPPAPEKPAIKEPSGATREEHRQVAPQPAQRTEHAQTAPAEPAPGRAESHVAPQQQQAAPVQDQGNRRERQDMP